MASSHDIIAQARTWLGTRFHHQGRLKKTSTHAGGVDCLGLLVCIARDLDLRGKDGAPLHSLDAPDYAHYPDGAALIAGLSACLTEIPIANAEAGDVLVIRIDDSPRHLALLSQTNPPHIIHAYAQARKVVEQPLDEFWQPRITHVFKI